MAGDPIDPRYNGLRYWDNAVEDEAGNKRNVACCAPPTQFAAPCSELPERDKRDVRSSVDSFLRSFPMADADGSWRRDATRRERAEYRLGMMAKERARLDFEEQLLRQEIAKAKSRKAPSYE